MVVSCERKKKKHVKDWTGLKLVDTAPTDSDSYIRLIQGYESLNLITTNFCILKEISSILFHNMVRVFSFSV